MHHNCINVFTRFFQFNLHKYKQTNLLITSRNKWVKKLSLNFYIVFQSYHNTFLVVNRLFSSLKCSTDQYIFVVRTQKSISLCRSLINVSTVFSRLHCTSIHVDVTIYPILNILTLHPTHSSSCISCLYRNWFDNNLPRRQGFK